MSISIINAIMSKSTAVRKCAVGSALYLAQIGASVSIHSQVGDDICTYAEEALGG